MTRQATAIIQARMGSSRLPGKVLMEVLGRTLMDWQVDRLSLARRVDSIVLATTTDPKDDPLADWAQGRGLLFYRGSEDDVLDRYRRAADQAGAEHVIRITGDCPLLEPLVVDRLVETYFEAQADYVHTTPEFCEGVDCEIFSRAVLETAWQNARLASEREHVTQYLHNNKSRFRIVPLENGADDSRYRFTVDEPEDFQVVKAIMEALDGSREPYFTVEDIKSYLDGHPEVAAVNSSIIRNEGLLKSLAEDHVVKP